MSPSGKQISKQKFQVPLCQVVSLVCVTQKLLNLQALALLVPVCSSQGVVQWSLELNADGVPSVATFISMPIPQSSEPAPPLSSLNTTVANGLVGGVTGPRSPTLAASAPQGPSAIGDSKGTDGVDPPNVAEVAMATSNSFANNTASTAGRKM